jgi:hypothetical protein
MSILDQLKSLKEQYQACQDKARQLKTKSAKEKQWDKMRDIRCQFAELARTYNFSQFALAHLNIMSMIGGPYYVDKAATIDVRTNYGTRLQVCIDNEWAGMIELLDNPCGIDNLNLLLKQAS